MTTSDKSKYDQQPKISRRNLIAGTAGTAAVAAIGLNVLEATAKPKNDADPANQVSLPKNGKSVLVIGGGLSGLISGAELIDRGFDVTILEKNASLGGRLRSWRDKSFGEQSNSPDWQGHPIEHGTHVVFNYYSNLKDVFARRGLSPRKKRINHPTATYSFAYPDGTIDDRVESKTLAPFHMTSFLNNLKYVSEDSKKIAPQALRKMLSFDPSNPEEVAYLDTITLEQWCLRAGFPLDVIHAILDPFSDMGNFLAAKDSNALYFLRATNLMLGHWKDAYCAQFYQDSTNDTIFEPLAKYIQEKGGKIIFNAELDEYISDGEKITAAKTKAGSSAQYICPICGEIHDSEPHHCRRCGWGGGGFISKQKDPETYAADYYLLGVDIPNAKKILSKSPFKEKNLYPNIDKLPTSSVAIYYLWYPRAKKVGDIKTNWEDHFGTREALMTADFPMLATVINLSYLKKNSFEEFDADIIEVQIARMENIAGKTDNEVADAIDKDLRDLIPGLPTYTDLRVMKWDNFTCGTINSEPYRPNMATSFDNFYILGDWIQTDHNCFLMEKTAVNAKRAVNYLLADIGQKEGHMNILETGTPNLSVELVQKLFSVKV